MKYIYSFIAMVVLLSSCTSAKPTYYSVSEYDYNKRRKVNNAGFKFKITPIGVATTLAGTAGGAYLMNEQQAIKTNTDDELAVNNQVANYAVGGLLGFGLTSLLNYAIAQQGSRRSISKTPGGMNTWVKTYDRHSYLVSSNGNDGTFIDRRVEQQFIAKNLEDARQFYRIFSGSRRKEQVFTQAIAVVKRDELPELMTLFPTSSQMSEAKLAYQNRSTSIAEVKQAINTYGQQGEEISTKSADLVQSAQDALIYHELFGQTPVTNIVYQNAFKSSVGNELPRFESIFGNFKVANIEAISNANGKQQRNFMRYVVAAERPTSLQSLRSIYETYRPIKYATKSDDFAEAVWNTADPLYPRGDEMLVAINRFTNPTNTEPLGIETGRVKAWVARKLNQIAARALAVVDYSFTDAAKSYDYDTWRRSVFYDAPYINETGPRKFIMNGYLRNNSKFTLPVKAEMTAYLMKTREVEVLNFNLSGLIPKSDRTSLIGQKKVDYFVPSLEPNSRREVAVLFDFGQGSLRDGINMIIQVSSEVYIADKMFVATSLLKENVSKRQLDRQRIWMTMDDPSLSKVQVKGFFGYDYSPEDYEIDLSGYGADYYQEEYGSDCGCGNPVGDVESEFWTNNKHYFIELENGQRYEYSLTKDGVELHDGILGAFRSDFDSYGEMIQYIIDDCLFFTCEKRN